MHAALQSSAVSPSRLLRNARAEKQCSGFCTCAISVPITFGKAPAQASQGLLRSHSFVTLLSAQCPCLVTVAGDVLKRFKASAKHQFRAAAPKNGRRLGASLVGGPQGAALRTSMRSPRFSTLMDPPLLPLRSSDARSSASTPLSAAAASALDTLAAKPQGATLRAGT